MHNASVEISIASIRVAMDDCDDVQMCEHLAKKLSREKHRLIPE